MLIWLVIILSIFILIFSVSLIQYSIQDKFIFHAEKLPENYEFSVKNDFDEINLKTDDGNNLNGLLIKVENPKGIILYFHNHAGNINHSIVTAVLFNNLNYDVLMMDYRGYGKSTGKFNEQDFLKDSKLWYNCALENYDESIITVYGRGIGATFATYVASLNNPKQLCLESPVFNLNYVVKDNYPYLPYQMFLKYKFNTAKYLVNVKCKVYIFHGKQNELVHYTNSEKLYELSKENSELNIIPDGNHYNLINNETVFNRIKEILSA